MPSSETVKGCEAALRAGSQVEILAQENLYLQRKRGAKYLLRAPHPPRGGNLAGVDETDEFAPQAPKTGKKMGTGKISTYTARKSLLVRPNVPESLLAHGAKSLPVSYTHLTLPTILLV